VSEHTATHEIPVGFMDGTGAPSMCCFSERAIIPRLPGGMYNTTSLDAREIKTNLFSAAN